MIYTVQITVGSETVLLVIAEPDWAKKFRVTAQMETSTRESITGIAERRKQGEGLRFGMRYVTQLDDTDLQQLRTVLGGLDGMRVAMPFWPDVYEDWANRLIDGQYSVGWNAGYSSVTAATGQPGRTWETAMLVGRLNPPVFKAVTDELAEVTLDFVEESPWEMRADPWSVDPGTWQADWQADWTRSPQQGQRSFEDREYIGRGRVPGVGGESLQVWTQKSRLDLSSPDLGEFLAFWFARGGSWQGFDIPGVLQPGSETPTAPHEFDSGNGQVTFSSDRLTLNFYLPDAAEIDIAVQQQVETASHDEAAVAYAYLYHIQYGSQEQRLTDWEAPVSAGGHSWTPARIEHNRIRQSLKPQEETCELEAWLDDVPLLQPLMRMETETPVLIDVYEVELPSGTPRQLFAGKVLRARGKGKSLRVEVASFRGSLKRQIPRIQFSHTCNHTLFSYGCIRRRTSQMAITNWQSTGEFVTQWDDPKLILDNFSNGPSVPATPADHFWAGGWCDVGSGVNRQLRAVIGSWIADGQVILALARPLRTEVISAGDTVTFWPGCDGQYSTCRNRFSNGENFGGFPFIPAYIEQAPSGMPSGGK